METIGIHPTCSEEIVKSKPTKREEENPEAHGCWGWWTSSEPVTFNCDCPASKIRSGHD